LLSCFLFDLAMYDLAMWTRSSQHHILLLLVSFFEKSHCRCKHSPQIPKKCLRIFKNLFNSRILMNFKTGGHEFSNYECMHNNSTNKTSSGYCTSFVTYFNIGLPELHMALYVTLIFYLQHYITSCKLHNTSNLLADFYISMTLHYRLTKPDGTDGWTNRSAVHDPAATFGGPHKMTKNNS